MDKVELIDRIALLEMLPQICDELNGCSAPYNFDEHCVGCEVYMLHKMLTDLPAVDAAPVRRSEWVTDDDNNDDWAEPYCKKCGCSIPCGPAHFCPNCGSDMRGETHGTD